MSIELNIPAPRTQVDPVVDAALAAYAEAAQAYATAELGSVAATLREGLPNSTALVMSKSTNDRDRAVICLLIVYDAAGTVLWRNPEHTYDHPGMPRPTPVPLHDGVVAVLTRRLADAYDAQGGCTGPLQPHDESSWDGIGLNLLIFDIAEALDARRRAALPASSAAARTTAA
jgi:hypothetical protein